MIFIVVLFLFQLLQVFVFCSELSISCGCLRHFEPVCGSDSKTYNNVCELQCAQKLNPDLNLNVAYRGTCCPPEALCPVYSDPVCDNYGTTHENECVFTHRKCLSLRLHSFTRKIVARGNCGTRQANNRTQCSFFCDERNEPICDTLGKTHKNYCKFELTKCRLSSRGMQTLEVKHWGSCEVTLKEVRRSEPKAPNDSQFDSKYPRRRDTYVEPFYLPRKGLSPNSPNPYATSPLHPITITPRPDAAAAAYEGDITGNDHSSGSIQERTTTIEYPFDYKRMDETMQPINIEAGEYKCSAENCVKTWDPVCDTKNKTHKNECMFRFYACKLMKSSNEVVEINYKGECSKKGTLRREPPKESHANKINCKNCDSEQEIVPICDNANQTHQSICLLAQWNCEQRRKGLEERVLVHIGHCHMLSPVFSLEDELCPSKCSKRHKPVCDTHGNTHPNLCTFQMVNCKERQEGKKDTPWLGYLYECSKPEEPRQQIIEMRMQKLPTAEAIDEKVPLPELPSTYKFFPVVTASPMFTPAKLKPEASTQSPTNPIASTRIPFTPLPTTSTKTFGYSQSEYIRPKIATLKIMSEQTGAPVFLNSTFPTPTFPPKNNLTTEITDIEIVTTGIPEIECPQPKCVDIKNPVCDNEGTVHKNECLFTFARCVAAQRGKVLMLVPDEECREKENQPFTISCSNEWMPICGSDFVTYPNKCIFQKAQSQNPELEVLFTGECERCLKEPCPHIDLETETDDSLFVCDQTGETRTFCEFRMLQCIFELNFKKNLTESHKGRCCPPNEVCTLEDEPVCDSVGQTHKNKCFFEVAKCRREKVEQVETISIAKIGSCSSYGIDRYNKISPRPDILSNFKDELPLPFCEPSACVNSYEPVCGSDGKTYVNLCFFKMKTTCNDSVLQEIQVAYTGECCNFECTNEYSPICDNYGETHLNLCVFGKKRCLDEKLHGKNLTISAYKPCLNLDCDIVCTQDYTPICGTDGKTYPNECMLKKIICLTNNIGIKSPTLDYLGECCPEDQCVFDFRPVCDSQGRTHVNECVFRKNACLARRKSGLNISIAYHGECCTRECDASWKPVCDGQKTHPNICMFRIKQCEAERRSEVLSLAYAGECCLLPNGECAGSGSICDSDGQTHRSRCYFEQKRCITEKIQPKHLTVVHSGDCCTIEHCQKDDAPVCDNRGGTHASTCHFQNTKCIHEKIHPNSTLLLAYKGACCENHCDGNWAPVCDQHGTVYKNKCLFQLRACEYDKRSGTKLLQTPCTDSQTKRMLRHLLIVHKRRR